jgi:hypothetical protein
VWHGYGLDGSSIDCSYAAGDSFGYSVVEVFSLAPGGDGGGGGGIALLAESVPVIQVGLLVASQ